MKSVFVCFMALVASASAFAAGPVIEKSSGAGFVPPQYQRFESCEVYTDRVVIRRGFADLVTSEIRNVQITGDLAAMIRHAEAESIEQRANSMCDAPHTTISARVDSADIENRNVELFLTGGCGSPRSERQGPASRALRNLIDEYCPTTHDHVRE